MVPRSASRFLALYDYRGMRVLCLSSHFVSFTLSYPYPSFLVWRFYSNRLSRDFAGFALKPSHFNAYELPDFVSGSLDSLNLTEIMLSEPSLFHVIVGAHGVGKSVAVRMAAAELSKSRTVKYLFAPPADLELYKLFYVLPEWLLIFRKFLSCVIVDAT